MHPGQIPILVFNPSCSCIKSCLDTHPASNHLKIAAKNLHFPSHLSPGQPLLHLPLLLLAAPAVLSHRLGHIFLYGTPVPAWDLWRFLGISNGLPDLDFLEHFRQVQRSCSWFLVARADVPLEALESGLDSTLDTPCGKVLVASSRAWLRQRL